MEEFRIDPTIAYDVVELPSKGIHYQNKKKSLRVAYLTAADENILSSPNLVATNTVVDELLKRKILDKDINIDDIIDEDRQAILIFLRNTAFGSEYKITTSDPKTGESFTFEIDLSTLKIKDFNLPEDTNGEYSYFMEKSKVGVTFKFISQKQENDLEQIKVSWNGNGVAPVVTKRLEMMIKSVDGMRDQMGIYQFIQNLPIKDSQEFRKFSNENKPGIDLSVDVKTPSGDTVKAYIDFGVEFFRPFYGI